MRLWLVIITINLPKVILKQAALTSPMADPYVITVCNQSIKFAAWSRCARPHNTRFLWHTPLTIPNGSLIGSAILAWSRPHSPYTLHCTTDPFPSPQKNLPLPIGGGSWTHHLAHGSWDPPNFISIESAIFSQYILVTNGQTKR